MDINLSLFGGAMDIDIEHKNNEVNMSKLAVDIDDTMSSVSNSNNNGNQHNQHHQHHQHNNYNSTTSQSTYTETYNCPEIRSSQKIESYPPLPAVRKDPDCSNYSASYSMNGNNYRQCDQILDNYLYLKRRFKQFDDNLIVDILKESNHNKERAEISLRHLSSLQASSSTSAQRATSNESKHLIPPTPTASISGSITGNVIFGNNNNNNYSILDTIDYSKSAPTTPNGIRCAAPCINQQSGGVSYAVISCSQCGIKKGWTSSGYIDIGKINQHFLNVYHNKNFPNLVGDEQCGKYYNAENIQELMELRNHYKIYHDHK